MVANDTNKLHCKEDKEIDLAKFKGKCPFDDSDGSIMVSSKMSIVCIELLGMNTNHKIIGEKIYAFQVRTDKIN